MDIKEEIPLLPQKVFFTNKEFLLNNEAVECIEISILTFFDQNSLTKKAIDQNKNYYLQPFYLIFSEQGQKIMEVKCISNNRSIFYGDLILAEKNFYLITEIDPIFIAIYILDFAYKDVFFKNKICESIYFKKKESREKYLEIDEIFNIQTSKKNILQSKDPKHEDTIFKKFQEKFLQNKRFVRGLELICDTKEYEYEEQIRKFYRLNYEKLFDWLDKKYKIIQEALPKLMPLRFVKQEHLEEKCSDNFPSLDFLYSRLPCSVFEDYLSKRLKIQPFEFFSVKKSELKKKKIESISEDTTKKPSKKHPNKKKELPVVPPKNNKIITNYFNIIKKN